MDEGLLVYQKTFGGLTRSSKPLLAWQAGGAERVRREVRLGHYDHEGRSLKFVSADNPFTSGTVFFWEESEHLLFKTTMGESTPEGFGVALPEEIRFVEGTDLHVLRGAAAFTGGGHWSGTLNAVDEDRRYGELREAPRLRAKGERKLRVRAAGDGEAIEYALFDLSRGGLAFVCDEADRFKRGETIHVTEVEGSHLDEPLAGEIMSVRPLDGGAGHKVGVKFSEGG